jgi:hypothetical protein
LVSVLATPHDPEDSKKGNDDQNDGDEQEQPALPGLITI